MLSAQAVTQDGQHENVSLFCVTLCDVNGKRTPLTVRGVRFDSLVLAHKATNSADNQHNEQHVVARHCTTSLSVNASRAWIALSTVVYVPAFDPIGTSFLK